MRMLDTLNYFLISACILFFLSLPAPALTILYHCSGPIEESGQTQSFVQEIPACSYEEFADEGANIAGQCSSDQVIDDANPSNFAHLEIPESQAQTPTSGSGSGSGSGGGLPGGRRNIFSSSNSLGPFSSLPWPGGTNDPNIKPNLPQIGSGHIPFGDPLTSIVLFTQGGNNPLFTPGPFPTKGPIVTPEPSTWLILGSILLIATLRKNHTKQQKAR